jgi:hypothetical protein
MPIKVQPPPDRRGPRRDTWHVSKDVAPGGANTRRVPATQRNNPNMAIDDGIFDSCDRSLQSFSCIVPYSKGSETELNGDIKL